jgi:hypothetical protein
MKNLPTGIIILICLIISQNLFGQHLNGEKFSFPKGKSEWSDTIYKKLRTKKMVKEGVGAVLLAIRYKFEKEIETGKWYEIEITNKSHDTKVKFKFKSGHNQEVLTVKLNPDQTKIIRKFYWTSGHISPVTSEKDQYDDIYYPLEELLEK